MFTETFEDFVETYCMRNNKLFIQVEDVWSHPSAQYSLSLSLSLSLSRSLSLSLSLSLSIHQYVFSTARALEPMSGDEACLVFSAQGEGGRREGEQRVK